MAEWGSTEIGWSSPLKKLIIFGSSSFVVGFHFLKNRSSLAKTARKSLLNAEGTLNATLVAFEQK